MIETSETIGALSSALVDAQGAFEAVAKQANNPFFKSKYADLPAVVEAASPILKANGLAVSQLPDFDGENDLLVTRLIHSSGEWIQSVMRLYLPKKDAQGMGSALTYARRYSYMSILGLVADVDDDGNASAQQAPPPRSSRSTAPQAPPAAPANGDESRPITPQIKKAVENAIGRYIDWDEDSDAPLKFISACLGREVTSLDELTYDEGKIAAQQISKAGK